MRIDTLTDLTEAHQQTLMFHGTSSTFLRSIIASGIEPEPARKVWDQDPDAGEHSGSRVSLYGSYWTTNLLTAYGSAGRTTDKFKGERMIVMAQITESATYADEDSIRYTIQGAWGRALQEVLRTNGDAIEGPLWVWFGHPDDPTLKERWIDAFVHNIHEGLALSDKHPINRDLIVRLAQTLLLRQAAHAEHNLRTGNSWRKTLFKDWPEDARQAVLKVLPDPEQAERNYLAMLDQMGRTYRKTTRVANVGPTYYTTRVPARVGFSGAHKIVCIIELTRDKKTFKTTIRVRYGELPPTFIDLWTKSGIGSDTEFVT